ncbi:MAG: methionyl-tRNA formyltransferase [Planctomycetes bacterium]|nr:methionyl-tRNA formyltransferase [Planctomycetota bacterium]
MNIVYLGSGEFGLPCLDAIRSSRHSLALVVTGPASPAGRGRKVCPMPVAHWAENNAVPFIESENVNDPQIVRRIAETHPDVLLVIACGQKIGRELVNMPTKLAINVHSSLLPKYRGAGPINWAILRGETETGVSIITLADRMDAGDILAQARTPIDVFETAGELHDRLAQLAAPLLIETLDRIESDTVVFTPQNEFEATKAPKLKKSDGFLDFTEPAYILADKIRGLWPWPGAAANFVSSETGKTTRVILALAEVIWGDAPPQAAPGTFDEDLNVLCGEGKLGIRKIKPAGKGLMEFKAFINGWRLRAGDRLTKIEE